MDAIKDLVRIGHDILTYQIFTIENQGFSLSTLLTGAVLVLVGYVVCKRIAKTVEQRVLSRVQMEVALRHSLSQVVFYVLFVFWVLFTLRLLSVPLTIFTVVGSALAVGIGFGSTVLVSNFISGLMVMLEQPLKVGDFIEIKGVTGIVQRIGIRATQIRTLSNIHVLIPNKTFLEEALTNFSLAKGLVRSRIQVGVAYGSDINKVIELGLQAVKEDSQVNPTDPPIVNLMDFADNCLLFEIRSWVNSQEPGDVVLFESRVRVRLYEKFNANKIAIPFPQRDIRVEMIQPGQKLL